MDYKGKSQEFISINIIGETNCYLLKEVISEALSILWFRKDGNTLKIDGIDYEFNKNQIICLTEFHKIEVQKIYETKLIRFNRPFYCIKEHDTEVSCKGMLFFGASQLPIFKIPKSELKIFKTVFEMFVIELKTKDNLQLEMLQMMLKRFLILCARVYKEEHQLSKIENTQVELIREYNFLVEQYFKTKHTVAEYAELLHKSPKTLANLFAKVSDKTPLQFIQERRMLEARRLLYYTNKNIKEIAYEIGFQDIQSFGRFFKKIEGLSPSLFRENK